jgi:hypothetical protein
MRRTDSSAVLVCSLRESLATSGSGGSNRRAACAVRICVGASGKLCTKGEPSSLGVYVTLFRKHGRNKETDPQGTLLANFGKAVVDSMLECSEDDD